MSDRPTPETDDIARGNHVVPTEWAEQLERERDEAREKLSARWQSLRDSQDEVLRLTFENRELSQSIEGWENKWKCAIDMAARAELERDEARRKLNNLDVTAIHSCYNECQRPICVLRRERDEAREALNKILKNE